MTTLAKLSNVRTSAQKCRLVADQIRGLDVADAMTLLSFSPKKSARLIKKVLESAIANAEHNDGADVDDLRVTEIAINEGPSLKRMSPRAKGRANRISKPTCHIMVRVSDNR